MQARARLTTRSPIPALTRRGARRQVRGCVRHDLLALVVELVLRGLQQPPRLALHVQHVGQLRGGRLARVGVDVRELGGEGGRASREGRGAVYST